MLKNLFKTVMRTSLAGTVQQQLDEAQLHLLQAEAQLENAECYVQTYRKRVTRLQTRLRVVKAEDSGAHATYNIGSGEHA